MESRESTIRQRTRSVFGVWHGTILELHMQLVCGRKAYVCV